MSMTRRSFLKSGATTVLTAGIALSSTNLVLGQDLRRTNPSRDFKVPFQAQQSPLFYFKRETFEPYVGGIFRARAGARSLNMTLISVTDCTPAPKSKLTSKARTSECFSLVFRSTGKLTDLTSIFNMEHGALGNFDLFMTRRDGPRGTYFYEAVFNHAI
ncbi:MAG: hypothetical protein QOJ76_2887 [Acidobacteriota bacterium]|jgi:hypothetical protein|nr:hypothetical protein [Acidobacteriota bacterium]